MYDTTSGHWKIFKSKKLLLYCVFMNVFEKIHIPEVWLPLRSTRQHFKSPMIQFKFVFQAYDR